MYMIVEGAFLLSPIGATFGIRTSILQGRKEKEKHGGGVTNVSVNTLKFLCRDPQGWDDLPVLFLVPSGAGGELGSSKKGPSMG